MADIDLKNFIRDIPDFPKPGILFKDITPLLKDARAFQTAIYGMRDALSGKHIDYIVGIESRGFLFGAALAVAMGVGFVPVRKKGKLPYKTRQVMYDLEYGQDCLEIHEDALMPGNRVVIMDDLLATGGTGEAVVKLVRGFQADIVMFACIVELAFLNGREKLNGLEVYALIGY